MAAAFPYRGVPGTMPPGVPPPPPAVAPIPDYMTEEKLQEKGELTSFGHAVHFQLTVHISVFQKFLVHTETLENTEIILLHMH